ncbi:unnamed protein product [Mesocestoides corti]|uniref:Exosome complex component 10 homolog n=1 Tax=Mesocestoides corti TaxID=53468 RepID=A0A0R3UEN9_MESCO|nr:unnamed protein product [Mesocestoides corti]
MSKMPSESGFSGNDLTTASKRIISTLVPSVANAVKISHEFPTASTPAFTYYNDFPQYKAVMNGNANKILSLIQQIIDEIHGEANVLDVRHPKSLEEQFSTIVDVNDRVIDRISSDLDREEFPDKANNNSARNLVIADESGKMSPALIHKKSKMMDSSLQKNREFNTLSPNSVKLLASKNISRPQILFTVAPDNSNAPFLPILKTKPNAIVRLEDCDLTADPETGDYTHPYLKELEEFGKCLELYVHVPAASNPVPLPLEETPLIFVDSTVTLESMLMELSSEQEIAVDLEHHSYRTFLGITCLIQLSSRTKDYIVDAIALRDHLGNFNKLFTDPKIVKVLHGSDMDLMWLQRDFGVYIVNLFDTGQAARALQLPRFSLSYLLQHFAGVYTNKAYQLADWRIRPLPEELVTYARTDTHYLLYIAEQLRNHLADRGLLSSVLERSRELCLRIYKKPTFDPLGYLSMPNMLGGVSLNKRQLYALKHLCILRDSIARREDESLNYVLPNHMLRLIAEELPRETTGIFACCSPIPPLVRKYVFDIHKIVLDARNNKLNELVIDDSAAQFKSDRAEQRTERSSVLVLDMLQQVPLSDPKLDEEVTSLAPQDPAATNEDPLYKPPSSESTSDSSGKGPSKLTLEEVIQVEELGATFRPGRGRSAQSRAFANLKRQQQQRRTKQQPSTWDNEKRPRSGNPHQDRLPPKRHSNGGADGEGEEDEDGEGKEEEKCDVDTEVVILRDQKLARSSKGAKQTSRQPPPVTQTENFANVSRSPLGQSPEAQVPPQSRQTPTALTGPQSPASTGRRRNRGRGGRQGGRNAVLRKSLPSLSSGGGANATPLKPLKKRGT